MDEVLAYVGLVIGLAFLAMFFGAFAVGGWKAGEEDVRRMREGKLPKYGPPPPPPAGCATMLVLLLAMLVLIGTTASSVVIR